MQVFHWNLSRLGTAAGDWYCMTRSEMVFPLEDFCWTGLWKNWIKLKGSAGGHAPVPDSGTSSGVQGHALPGNVWSWTLWKAVQFIAFSGPEILWKKKILFGILGVCITNYCLINPRLINEKKKTMFTLKKVIISCVNYWKFHIKQPCFAPCVQPGSWSHAFFQFSKCVTEAK